MRNVPETYTLQVCDNLLGILSTPAGDVEPKLTIWNWTTGKVILVIVQGSVEPLSDRHP
jgi:hypothetical protein